MAEPFFLKKRARPRALGAARPTAAAGAGPAPARRPPRPMPPRPAGAGAAGPSKPGAKPAAKPATKPEVKAETNKDNLVEIQIFSADPDAGLRYNLMKLSSNRDVDPSKFPQPLLLNRKQPGPRAPPQFQHDENGNIVGRFVYDENGKPVLDDEGKPVVEKKNEIDMSLVGSAPGMSNKRRGKRNTKEVFHQDVEVIKLRREEANPWVLEPKNPSEKPAIPEHWVGRMTEPSSLPTILLINEGEGASFTMVPLGRTYNFQSQRPFKVMDSDQANKYFEMQAKYKVHDRWGQRQEDVGPGLVKTEETMRGMADRAQRMEYNIAANKGNVRAPTVKREKFEDDYVREGRNVGRGLDGGIDEELDFDVAEEFADDEDSNTFYYNKEEEEEKKLQEDRQKQEYRWANANVGDRPQIEEDKDDEDDLFGEKLTSEGKRLRKMMRRRREEDGDMYGSSDDDDDTDSEEEREKEKEKEQEKEKDKDKAAASRNASRAGSKAPDSRDGTGSPARKLKPPTPERAGTAPPGAGAALLAKRAASRGASPRPRGSSPLARGSSPVDRGSPAPTARGSSPMGRDGSPAPGREGTPSGTSKPKSKSAKRKATSQSPLRDDVGTPSSSAAMKRKSPDDAATPSTPGGDSPAGALPKKKKKARASSGTPAPEPYPGMITRDEVLTWLRAQPNLDTILMKPAIDAFIPRLNVDARNREVFLGWIQHLTTRVKTPDASVTYLNVRPQFR